MYEWVISHHIVTKKDVIGIVLVEGNQEAESVELSVRSGGPEIEQF